MDPVVVGEYLERSCRSQDGILVERASGRRVAGLVPVDLYGHPADWDRLVALARNFELKIVEDACQAHGARYRGARCGTFGHAAAFSFYPGKNLGAMGEAGAITTADAAVAEQCRVLRDHGQQERYIHITGDGSNARLDALQAAVLSAKLQRLEAWNEARRRVAGWYASRLEGLGVTLPQEMPWAAHVYHLYVVLLDERDRVRSSLDRAGVQTGLHYPVPLHLQRAYASLGHRCGDFPVSERVASQALSLPMFPHLTETQVDTVVAVLRTALASGIVAR
jgi:dTDP-4-amino-4,6-dideoxygalactose transaminase